jgi:hypothetical protein
VKPWRQTGLALTASIVVAGFVAGVIWRIHSSGHPVDTATIYAGYLAVAAIAVTLLMAIATWWRKGLRGPANQASTPLQAAAAADRLADLMVARWRQEAIARRIVTPAPATVRWRWAAGELAVPRKEVTTPPPPGTGPFPLPDLHQPGDLLESGVVARLHDEVYARLPHGRLVLTGGAGAGKTGSMILLLLAALAYRACLTSDQRAKVPVPVWLTLGGWDPVTTPLQKWAAATMNRDHPALLAADYGPDAASELLCGGRVALFLDGLDEMPGNLRARALQRLDHEGRALRVVLTSRPEEYRGAVQTDGLTSTAVIELRPVRPNAAATYLQYGQTGLNRGRWEQVGAYLKGDPGSVAAQALDNPLTLSLARDAYSLHDPAALIDPARFPTVEAFRQHLIDQLLVTAYPDQRRRAHVTSWLTWTASQMGTSRDLPWWDIPTWIPPWKLHVARWLTIAVIVGSVTAFAATHLVGLVTGHIYGPTATIASALAVGTAAGAVVENGIGFWHRPATLTPRLPRMRDLAWMLRLGLLGGLAVALAVGFGVALAAALVSASAARAGYGLIVGLVVGYVFGLVAGLTHALRCLWAVPIATSPSATAAGSYRTDLGQCSIAGLMTGLACGLTAGLAAGLKFGIAFGLESSIVFGLGAGIVITLIAGQVPLVKLTELVLTCQGKGRVRFLHLLEEASNRQVLRQAGAVYQFRHAALQDRLTETCSQPHR